MSQRMANLVVTIAVAMGAVGVAIAATGGADALTRVYADSSGALHVVSSSGDDRIVGRGIRWENARLGPDGRTYGALVLCTIDTDPPHHNMADVCEKLMIWRDGRRIRMFVPGDFIRDWGFWKDGKQVAIYSGGLHFAGQYQLHDLATGRSVAFGTDPVTDQSPAWMRSLEP